MHSPVSAAAQSLIGSAHSARIPVICFRSGNRRLTAVSENVYDWVEKHTRKASASPTRINAGAEADRERAIA